MKTKKSRIIRRIVISMAIVITLMGSGCLSVFQEISAKAGNKVETQVRFSMSKAMLTAMDSMGGEPAETDEIFDTENGPINPENIPGLTNLVVEDLDNDVDVGIYFKGTISKVPSGLGPADAPFIPFEDGNTITIGLPTLDENAGSAESSESDEMGAMFFASSKYQLSLDKNLYPDISSARVMVGSEEYPASVLELAGSWLVEFPIIYWMQAPKGCLLVLEK